jgi:hypothetical protein
MRSDHRKSLSQDVNTQILSVTPRKIERLPQKFYVLSREAKSKEEESKVSI